MARKILITGGKGGVGKTTVTALLGICLARRGARVALIDTDLNLAVFYAHHMLNPQEDYYQPRLRNVIYSCL